MEKTSEFVQMLEKEFPDIYKRMMKEGRRNISLSTVAPTGSISLLTRTSSGIEPVFMLSYKRRRKIVGNYEGKADYVDNMGDSFEEFEVFHPGLLKWMRVTGQSDISKSPYSGFTARRDRLAQARTDAVPGTEIHDTFYFFHHQPAIGR